jgi:hypothetical protein
VKTADGKRNVKNLLREMEFLYSGETANIKYDVSWIRRELGIE